MNPTRRRRNRDVVVTLATLNDVALEAVGLQFESYGTVSLALARHALQVVVWPGREQLRFE